MRDRDIRSNQVELMFILIFEGKHLVLQSFRKVCHEKKQKRTFF